MNVLEGKSLYPAQTDQFVQVHEPHLPDFLYHLDEDKVPVLCFPMTNPYKAILTHDPARTCVCVSPPTFSRFNTRQMELILDVKIYLNENVS